MSQHLPKIHSRLAELSVVDTLTLPWFLTIFLSSMPFHAATLIVDAFFLDGAAVIFRVALAILRENQEALLNCRDEGEIMLLLSGFMESVYSREAAPKEKNKNSFSKIFQFQIATYNELLQKLAKLHYKRVIYDRPRIN